MTDETKDHDLTEESEDLTATATEEAGEAEEDGDKVEFVEDPTFEIDYKGECAYEVGVKIPVANEVQEAAKMLGKLKSEVELPGFRRGRAPLKLVENKFTKAVRSEVEGKMVSAAFEKLVEDEDLKPLGMPDVDGLEELADREEGAPIAVTFKFEVGPRIELGKYRGIDVERPVITIDEKDVEESIEQMLSRYAVYEDLEDGAAAEEDQVVIDFNGTIDGEPFQGGQADNYPYILGSKRFFPEFETILLGASAGDELSCDVTFPDDYFAEDLREKQAVFTIKVNEVKRQNVPELTDEFAQQMEYEDVADMRAKVKSQISESAEMRSKQAAESAALETVVEDSSFEIPVSMIDRIASDYQEEEVRRLMGMRIPKAQIDEGIGEIETTARESAIRNVKSMVTLNEIGEAEGIEVTEEDMEQEVESLMQATGADMETLARYFSQEKERNSSVDRIYRKKAIAVIIDNANVVDKELTREEMEEEEASTEG